MTAHTTQKELTENTLSGNLFLALPDTDLSDYFDEIEELADFSPEIIEKIENDLDAHAREKKRQRQADKKFYESRTADFPQLDIQEQNIPAEALRLGTGRPRMSAHMVYLFLMLRGFLGSLCSKPAQRLIHESITLYALLQNKGERIPSLPTILENVNQVSHATRQFIFDRQIEYALEDELDDFGKLTIDSTSVKANSSWPTDARILTGLLERACRLGQQLHVFGLTDFHKGWCPKRLAEMDALVFGINLVAGKPKSKGKLKNKYRRLLKRGDKTIAFLFKELTAVEENLVIESFSPSRRVQLLRVLDQIRNDLEDARSVAAYTENRVFHGKTLPSTEKVLSLSDGSAAYIVKGSRTPVIGYKPQLVRSANGFVTTLIVPEGNAADSAQLVPAITDSIARTGIIAEVVSTDDGYASKKGRNELLDIGVGIVSISGSKGKKLTAEKDWQSEVYKTARSDRSAVESLMFTIKDGFEFGLLGRRGVGKTTI